MRPVFKSGFADELNKYLDYKISCGYKEDSYIYIFKKFDHFCADRGISDVSFSRENADAWAAKKDTEATITHYARVNKVKCFLEFLSLSGYDVYHMHDVFFKATDFQPHIYTDDEIIRYFRAVDTYSYGRNRLNAVQIPVLFRLLYCCGTRISETLGIRKRDVDMDNGIIRLQETKNGCERYIVLGTDMRDLMIQFSDKCFYLLSDEDYIFCAAPGERRNSNRLHDIHRRILSNAGIPFLGGGYGTRVHDWRHTFAVRSFKQKIDEGMDMYVALPILSAYLGHKTIYATEHYVRLTMELFTYLEEKYSQKFKTVFGKEASAHEAN